jgi:hypothetical protein
MFKVWVKTAGDENCSTNAITHDTVDEAIAYAKDLHGRWMAVTDWFVAPEDAELKGHPSEEDVKAHMVANMTDGVCEAF